MTLELKYAIVNMFIRLAKRIACVFPFRFLIANVPQSNCCWFIMFLLVFFFSFFVSVSTYLSVSVVVSSTSSIFLFLCIYFCVCYCAYICIFVFFLSIFYLPITVFIIIFFYFFLFDVLSCAVTTVFASILSFIVFVSILVYFCIYFQSMFVSIFVYVCIYCYNAILQVTKFSDLAFSAFPNLDFRSTKHSEFRDPQKHSPIKQRRLHILINKTCQFYSFVGGAIIKINSLSTRFFYSGTGDPTFKHSQGRKIA